MRCFGVAELAGLGKIWKLEIGVVRKLREATVLWCGGVGGVREDSELREAG